MAHLILTNDGIDSIGKKILETAGIIVDTNKIAQQELIKIINEKKYIGLTVRSATEVRKDLIDACPTLKIIARGGVGMDNIDVEYAQSKGIKVINTPAASSNSVAELVFSHLFNAVRFVYQSNRQMPNSGNTNFNELKKQFSGGIELKGKTIGIIGFGRIGQTVAKIALGCEMNVIAYDPFVKEANITIQISNVEPIKIPLKTQTLDTLLAQSDFISCHVPQGKLITKLEIEKMKKGIILINTSRGGVINELDLIDGLNSGKINHACLDVFENEPTPLNQLLIHPKISLTPHIGAATVEAQERIGIELAEKIIDTLKTI